MERRQSMAIQHQKNSVFKRGLALLKDRRISQILEVENDCEEDSSDKDSTSNLSRRDLKSQQDQKRTLSKHESVSSLSSVNNIKIQHQPSFKRASTRTIPNVKSLVKSSMLRQIRNGKLRVLKMVIRTHDIISFCLGTLAMVIGPIEFEMFFKGDNDVQYTHTPESTALRLIISLLSLALILTNYNYYHLDFKYHKAKGSYDDLKKRFRESTQFKTMMITNFINLLHPIPMFEYQFVMKTLNYPVRYSLSAVLSNLLFLRFYLLIRVIVQCSKWTDVESESICEKEGFRPNFLFSLKAWMKQRPFLSILINFVCSMLAFGFAVRTFERSFYEDREYANFRESDQLYQNYNYVWNSFWLIVVTMSSVGYGDFYPITHLGRFVVVIASFWGMVMVSQFIYTMEVQSNFTPAQSKAYELLQRLEKRKELREDAALLIQAWWIYIQARLYPFDRRLNTSGSESRFSTDSTMRNFTQLNEIYHKRVEIFRKQRSLVERKKIPLQDSLSKTNSLMKQYLLDARVSVSQMEPIKESIESAAKEMQESNSALLQYEKNLLILERQINRASFIQNLVSSPRSGIDQRSRDLAMAQLQKLLSESLSTLSKVAPEIPQ
ncbi:hypothetical protein FGO68_gene17563 [Halteria grandinella]|uniref:Potassium channel domain-containing protein n=1 Tax=Halteria grandinella TaxID=5974 RepID=A0A8J8NWB3_HALGN|nr:hypothetical protein FGO68_gene17563 [Halteria grandinella]